MDHLTSKPDVSGMINEIKSHMPSVYAAIKGKAGVVGNVAFEWVRRGLRGEPGCFYAFEAGRVVGTPFHGHPVMDHVGRAMVQFGCSHVCVWPDTTSPGSSMQGGTAHGTA